MKIFLPAAFSVLAVFTMLSCKKSSTPDYQQGTGSCRINSIRQFVAGKLQHTEIIRYDDAGRINYEYIEYFPGGAEIDSFVYAGSNIFMYDYDSSKTVLHFIDTITLDNQGRLSTDNVIGYVPGAAHYYYNTDGSLSRQKDTLFSNGGTISYYYTWQNGDILKDSTTAVYPPEADYYTYDSTRLWQAAAPLTIYWFGILSCHPKHLPVIQETHSNFNSVTKFKIGYSFDAEGKIISDTLNGGRLVNLYSYECR